MSDEEEEEEEEEEKDNKPSDSLKRLSCICELIRLRLRKLILDLFLGVLDVVFRPLRVVPDSELVVDAIYTIPDARLRPIPGPPLSFLLAAMSDYGSPPPEPRPQPHPYLHEPLLYISNLPPFVRDEDLAAALHTCAPFRPKITRDGSNRPLSGTIEFKFLEKGE